MANDFKGESIAIDNRNIPTRIENLDIFSLNYYPENPRINFILSKFGDGLNQDDIEKNLWDEETQKLALEIRSNGGLLEDIIVMDNLVLEGNRRLCAYRHLYRGATEEQKELWKTIRAKVLLEQINVTEVFSLLSNMHIKGKIEWDPYEQASYIFKIMQTGTLTLDQLSQKVGASQSKIKLQLKAYELMRDNYLPRVFKLGVVTEKEALSKFSNFIEYYTNSELQEFANEHPEVLNDDKFVEWVTEERIRSAAYHVRKDLPDILKDKPARKVFLESLPEDAIDAAKETLYKDRPETGDRFFEALKKMTESLKKAPTLKIQDKINENPRLQYIINQFYSEAKNFYNNLHHDPNEEFIEKLPQKKMRH